jgi:hypothetical protein
MMRRLGWRLPHFSHRIRESIHLGEMVVFLQFFATKLMAKQGSMNFKDAVSKQGIFVEGPDGMGVLKYWIDYVWQWHGST